MNSGASWHHTTSRDRVASRSDFVLLTQGAEESSPFDLVVQSAVTRTQCLSFDRVTHLIGESLIQL